VRLQVVVVAMCFTFRNLVILSKFECHIYCKQFTLSDEFTDNEKEFGRDGCSSSKGVYFGFISRTFNENRSTESAIINDVGFLVSNFFG